MKMQKAYMAKKDRARPTIETGKGITEQSHKNETDINFILRDYRRTGFMKHAKEHQGRYDDVSVDSFQEAMFTVTTAQNMFNELPGLVRKEFDHDPGKFLEFVQNPENKEKMEKMGILRGNDGIDLNGVATNAPIVTQEVEAIPTPTEPVEPTA
jgi:hypothetical protein